jgi:hypothetical protein
MRTFPWKSLAWAIALMLAATPGWTKTACVPSSVLSSGPRGISLVGKNGSDPSGTLTYVVRDAGGVPVVGSVVMLNFTNCSDLRLSSDLGSPNVTVNCPAHAAMAVTGYDGSVTFKVVGSGSGGPPRTMPACAGVYVDGVPLSPPIVTVYDLDGMNGVNALDLSVALGDVNSGQYRPRSDYDFDGDVDPLDLCILARVVFSGGQSASGATCP